MSSAVTSSVRGSNGSASMKRMTTESVKSAGTSLLEHPVNKRYQIIERLGSGGMGVVFKALDSVLKREVAIKILTQEAFKSLGGEDAYSIYLNEAHVAASLQHPNIVRIYDFGQVEESQDKNPFLVMELILGERLLDVIRTKALSPIDLIKIFIQMSDALAYAHSKEKPILHRDVKPENILVDAKGRAVLIDFGLSRFVGSATTALDVFKGSFRTTAPEVIMGYFSSDAEKYKNALTPKMDLYSLGATFYLISTAAFPIPGNSLYDVKQKIENQYQIIPPKQISPHLPQPLSDILMKLLTLRPEDRFDSAEKVKNELAMLLRSLTPDDDGYGNDAAFEAFAYESGTTGDESIVDDILNESEFDKIEELKSLRQSDKEDKSSRVGTVGVAPTSKVPERVVSPQLARKSAAWKPVVVGATVLFTVLCIYYFFIPKPNKVKVTTAERIENSGMPPMQENGPEKVVSSMVENMDRQNSKIAQQAAPLPNKQNRPQQPYNNRQNYRLASAGTVESFGDDLVVYSRPSEKVQNSVVYNITLGTIIKDVVLTHKLVSYNIATPVRAELRTAFKIDDETILPAKTLFIGQAEVLPTKDRVHVKFFKIVTPSHQEVNFKGLALMADGSGGLVGQVERPKGKSPGVLAGTDVIGETGRVAINSLQPQTLGGQMGQVFASSSLSAAQRQLANSAVDLPIITVDAFMPLQIFVEETF